MFSPTMRKKSIPYAIKQQLADALNRFEQGEVIYGGIELVEGNYTLTLCREYLEYLYCAKIREQYRTRAKQEIAQRFGLSYTHKPALSVIQVNDFYTVTTGNTFVHKSIAPFTPDVTRTFTEPVNTTDYTPLPTPIDSKGFTFTDKGYVFVDQYKQTTSQSAELPKLPQGYTWSYAPRKSIKGIKLKASDAWGLLYLQPHLPAVARIQDGQVMFIETLSSKKEA